ncbi:MAG: type II toxin-antitoxin system RelE family toxin [Solirubrobacteraceae bacterium]
MPAAVELRPAAAKTLRRLSRPDRERILAAIERLPAADVRSLTGKPHQYRLRVGDWRVLFELVDRDIIVVYRVAARGSAYPALTSATSMVRVRKCVPQSGSCPPASRAGDRTDHAAESGPWRSP